MYIFGDASGRADAASPALRRAGVSIAAFHSLSINDVHLEVAIWGPLPGDRQTVVRGELLAMPLRPPRFRL
eukprot:6868614-Pyramimonas_sp.AAC.1